MRKLLFILPLLCAIVIVFIESNRLSADTVGNALSRIVNLPALDTGQAPAGLFTPEQQAQLDALRQQRKDDLAKLGGGPVTGLGLPAFVFLDGILLFTTVLIGLGFIIPAWLLGRVQGLITLIFAILLILAALVAIGIAIAKLLFMVALLLSFPFGTIVYLIVFGSFPKANALAVLAALFMLKLLYTGTLVLTHQRYIENKGLMLMIITTLVVGLIVSFIFGLMPGILASIVDAVAAIIVCIVAIIWAIILVIGAIIAIVLALKPG